MADAVLLFGLGVIAAQQAVLLIVHWRFQKWVRWLQLHMQTTNEIARENAIFARTAAERAHGWLEFHEKNFLHTLRK